ncbi:23S rRNA (pseudouridine(1915)-N(3))-methyltransferase RlmH [Desulfovulcanus sp.]
MSSIKFIWVGKLKKKYWQQSFAHYWNNLGKFYGLQEVIVRDVAHGTQIQRIEKEGELILNKIAPRDLVVTLDEKGSLLTSRELAQNLRNWIESGVRPCFIIGGAYGVSQAVQKKARFCLSLSPMTFPHEMARVILLEQLYRAATILKNFPYHH